MTDRDAIELIDALQRRYVRALDWRAMPDWYDCFDQGKGSYVCLSKENADQGLPLPLMMDDCPERLKDRIRFVTEVWAGTYEDYTTRHFVQRIEHRRTDDGIYRVMSNFMVTYTTAQRHSEILVAGVYEDEIAISGGSARFMSKQAVLDTVTMPRYLVYPV